jgi:type IV secretion system protein VirD4
MTEPAVFLKRVLPNLPYLFIFWFFGKLGMVYRLAPGGDIMHRLTGGIGMLGAAMADPMPSFVPADVAAGIAGAAAVCAAVYVKKKNAKKYRRDAEYGSARWGTRADIAPFTDANRENNIILTRTEGLTMNPRPANPKYARNKNMLVIGGSGSGKTRFIIKPNLMQCRSKDYPVSFVVTDPKGLLC